MRLTVSLLSLAVLILLVAAPARADDWGTLKGRIVYDGTAPQPDPITVTKDVAFCGKHNLTAEELVVNEENGGIANVVVWLYIGRGDDDPPVHESYKKKAGRQVLLTNDKCRFKPHVATLWTDQKLVLGNDDPIGHNTKIDAFRMPSNDLIPANAKLTKTYDAAERLPAKVSCSIHPWMQAWLLVQDHPYMAVTDKDGNFVIENLPAGTRTFQFWQEQAGYLSGVTIGGEEAEKGRVELTVKPGENDLGEIKAAPSVFKD